MKTRTLTARSNLVLLAEIDVLVLLVLLIILNISIIILVQFTPLHHVTDNSRGLLVFDLNLLVVGTLPQSQLRSLLSQRSLAFRLIFLHIKIVLSETFDFQILRHREEGIEIFLSDADLPVVDEVQNVVQIGVLDTFQVQ